MDMRHLEEVRQEEHRLREVTSVVLSIWVVTQPPTTTVAVVQGTMVVAEPQAKTKQVRAVHPSFQTSASFQDRASLDLSPQTASQHPLARIAFTEEAWDSAVSQALPQSAVAQVEMDSSFLFGPQVRASLRRHSIRSRPSSFANSIVRFAPCLIILRMGISQQT